MTINGWLAVFTGVLAVSTTLLWWETRKQGKATKASLALTKESVDAAVALELPLFSVGWVAIEPKSKTQIVALSNHGRTPALVVRSCLVIKLDQALPPKPRYPMHSVENTDLNQIIEKGGEYQITRNSLVSDDEWEKVMSEKSILWAYGYLEYLDFMQKKRCAGFCLAFEPRHEALYPSSSPSNGKWVQEGGPAAYTYNDLVSEFD